MVDSEPKVVDKPFAKSSSPLYETMSPGLVVKSNNGRGNNWALGYSDKPEKDSSLSGSVLELLRKEVEECDYYKGCVLLHSLAGGTGSGLGSKLIENIRDLYPVCFITAVSIFPSDSGDTPLQDYNSCLALNYLQEFADSVIYYENDEIMRYVSVFSQRGSNISTHNINECIAFSLSNLFSLLEMRIWTTTAFIRT
jgi:Tubulin